MKKLAYELGRRLAQEDFVKQAYLVPSLVGAGLGAGAGLLSNDPDNTGKSRAARALIGAGIGLGLSAVKSPWTARGMEGLFGASMGARIGHQLGRDPSKKDVEELQKMLPPEEFDRIIKENPPKNTKTVMSLLGALVGAGTGLGASKLIRNYRKDNLAKMLSKKLKIPETMVSGEEAAKAYNAIDKNVFGIG